MADDDVGGLAVAHRVEVRQVAVIVALEAARGFARAEDVGGGAGMAEAGTGDEIVDHGMLYGLSRAEATRCGHALFSQLQLDGLWERQPKNMSGGQKRRLDIVMGLVHEPSLVFLDEPTTGLDPRSRQMLWQVIDDVVAQGTAVLLTTQYLEEADRLADRVALISGGRIGTAGTPADLKRRVGEAALEFVVPTAADATALASDLAAFGPSVQSTTVRVPTDRSVAHTRAVLDLVDRTVATVDSWELRSPTLDDVFLAATGQPAEPATGNNPAMRA